MLTLLLASALVSAGTAPAPVAVRISEAQAHYRDCIADAVAVQPEKPSPDEALAAALGTCRDAELALRTACSAENMNAADTLGLVLDTRLDGQDEGVKRRGVH